MSDDVKLLREALETLEYVTYHDGRYEQHLSHDWQRQAQPLVQRLAVRLGVKPYADYGVTPKKKPEQPDPLGEALNSGDGSYKP
jgi:hypothetical protein